MIEPHVSSALRILRASERHSAISGRLTSVNSGISLPRVKTRWAWRTQRTSLLSDRDRGHEIGGFDLRKTILPVPDLRRFSHSQAQRPMSASRLPRMVPNFCDAVADPRMRKRPVNNVVRYDWQQVLMPEFVAAHESVFWTNAKCRLLSNVRLSGVFRKTVLALNFFPV